MLRCFLGRRLHLRGGFVQLVRRLLVRLLCFRFGVGVGCQLLDRFAQADGAATGHLCLERVESSGNVEILCFVRCCHTLPEVLEAAASSFGIFAGKRLDFSGDRGVVTKHIVWRTVRKIVVRASRGTVRAAHAGVATWAASGRWSTAGMGALSNSRRTEKEQSSSCQTQSGKFHLDSPVNERAREIEKSLKQKGYFTASMVTIFWACWLKTRYSPGALDANSFRRPAAALRSSATPSQIRRPQLSRLKRSKVGIGMSASLEREVGLDHIESKAPSLPRRNSWPDNRLERLVGENQVILVGNYEWGLVPLPYNLHGESAKTASSQRDRQAHTKDVDDDTNDHHLERERKLRSGGKRHHHAIHEE